MRKEVGALYLPVCILNTCYDNVYIWDEQINRWVDRFTGECWAPESARDFIQIRLIPLTTNDSKDESKPQQNLDGTLPRGAGNFNLSDTEKKPSICDYTDFKKKNDFSSIEDTRNKNDIENKEKEKDFFNNKRKNNINCECGAWLIPGAIHSTWCRAYNSQK